MPRALEPGGTFPIVLAIDQSKPADKRPTFYAKYLSGREQRQVLELSDKLQTATTNTEVFDAIFSSLRLALSGWDNMVDPAKNAEIKFSADNFEDILTSHEALELLQKAREGNSLDATDLGNLELPPSSEPGGSAESAAPIDALTAPQSSSPCSSNAHCAQNEAVAPAAIAATSR